MASETKKLAAAEVQTILNDEGGDILSAADYDHMEMFSSKTLGKTEAGVWVEENAKALFAGIYVKVTKNLLGPSFEVFSKAGVFNVSLNDELTPINFDIGTAKAGTVTSNTYAGADAKLKLAGGSAGPVDLNLGVGVSSGVGIKDDSVNVKVAGCGVTVGRKIGVSVFDNSISFDLGKFGKFWYDVFTHEDEEK